MVHRWLSRSSSGRVSTTLLFNLFINDLFSDSAGVRVPGLPDGRVADLKYADDVVALARSRNGLRRQLRTWRRLGGGWYWGCSAWGPPGSWAAEHRRSGCL